MTSRSGAWTAVLVSAILAASCSAKQGLEAVGIDLGGDEPEEFSLAVAGGEMKRAYDLLCPAYRFGIPFERFRAAVEANPFLTTATGVSIDSYRSGGGLALVKEGWIESSSGVAEAQAERAWPFPRRSTTRPTGRSGSAGRRPAATPSRATAESPRPVRSASSRSESTGIELASASSGAARSARSDRSRSRSRTMASGSSAPRKASSSSAPCSCPRSSRPARRGAPPTGWTRRAAARRATKATTSWWEARA